MLTGLRPISYWDSFLRSSGAQKTRHRGRREVSAASSIDRARHRNSHPPASSPGVFHSRPGAPLRSRESGHRWCFFAQLCDDLSPPEFVWLCAYALLRSAAPYHNLLRGRSPGRPGRRRRQREAGRIRTNYTKLHSPPSLPTLPAAIVPKCRETIRKLMLFTRSAKFIWK